VSQKKQKLKRRISSLPKCAKHGISFGYCGRCEAEGMMKMHLLAERDEVLKKADHR
jgi:hypothetical protein